MTISTTTCGTVAGGEDTGGRPLLLLSLSFSPSNVFFFFLQALQNKVHTLPLQTHHHLSVRLSAAAPPLRAAASEQMVTGEGQAAATQGSTVAGHGGSIGPDLLILPGTVITQRAEQTACAGSLCRTPTKGGRRRDLPTPASPCRPPPPLPSAKRAINQSNGTRTGWQAGMGMGMRTHSPPARGCTPCTMGLDDEQPPWISEAVQSTGHIPLPGGGNKSLLPLGTHTGCVCSQAERRGARDASSPLQPPVTAS